MNNGAVNDEIKRHKSKRKEQNEAKKLIFRCEFYSSLRDAEEDLCSVKIAVERAWLISMLLMSKRHGANYWVLFMS